jgi:hypothetical protein
MRFRRSWVQIVELGNVPAPLERLWYVIGGLANSKFFELRTCCYLSMLYFTEKFSTIEFSADV